MPRSRTGTEPETAGTQLLVFYGGTFDPVHNSHIAIACCARDALASEIRLMPAADPPHRALPGASAAQRAQMLDLAVAGEPGLLVDRRELLRATPSWTVDTLRELRAQIGASVPVALLLGADNLHGLPTWKDWQALFEMAHLVIAERADSPLDQGLPAPLERLLRERQVDSVAALRTAPSGAILRLRQPLQAGSSQDVRQRIAAGQPWQQLLPDGVADYIRRHRLYGVSAGPEPPAERLV